jgi:hypothetical protein
MYLGYVSQATPAYDTWPALRQIQQSLPGSGSARCTSWWLLFAKAIILMTGVSGVTVPSEEGGRICPCAQGSKELTLLTGRERHLLRFNLKPKDL